MSESSLTVQRYFEGMYGKKQARKMIAADLQEHYPEVIAKASQRLPREFVMAVIVAMSFQQTGEATIGTLAGMTAPFCKEPDKLGVYLEKAVRLDLVDFVDEDAMFKTRLTLSSHAVCRIRSYMYPLPLVVKPKHITHNKMNGYHTEALGIGSVMLNDKHTDDDVCLDNLNRLNNVHLKINISFYEAFEHEMKEKKDDIPNSISLKKKQEAFRLKTKSTDLVVQRLLFRSNGEFYLTHRYDHRGRVYSQGYHVNYQGDSWEKALIELAEPEYLTD